MVNYDCTNLNILHFDWLNLLQLKKKNWGWGGKIFFLACPLPLSSTPLVCTTPSLSLLQFTCLLYPISLSLSSSPLVSSTPSLSRLPLCRLPYDLISSMSSLLSVTYLGQRLFVYVSAPFLSIHISVPLLPDSLTIYILHSTLPHVQAGLIPLTLPFCLIFSSFLRRSCLSIAQYHICRIYHFPLHSPVHYHVCKPGLFQVIAARIRTCELSHHSLAHYQLTKLDSDSYPCKIRVFIL